jgi:indole-3-glycerol phosphate synthase
VLEGLYAGALADAKQRELVISLSEIEAKALAAPAALDVLSFFSGETISVISEIKRASPSKGHLADIPDPGELAKIYQSAGASAISVLTEQRGFLGSLADLERVREVVSVPVLRKDFISTEYQILEARALGADLILLIVAGLSKSELQRLKTFSEQLGMTVLIETHDLAEVEIAGELAGKLIGINARNLSTFETDRELFGSLAQALPSEAVKVAESAVRGVEDVKAYAQAGADAVLVGEALVKGDAAELISSFVEIPKA